jgi:hypothetical protein
VGEAMIYGEHASRAVRWSTDLDDYAPLCDSHNALLDHGGDWEMCPRGHVRVVWGKKPNGHCRGCARVQERARRRRLARKENDDA